jgi:hypothetical protein
MGLPPFLRLERKRDGPGVYVVSLRRSVGDKVVQRAPWRPLAATPVLMRPDQGVDRYYRPQALALSHRLELLLPYDCTGMAPLLCIPCLTWHAWWVGGPTHSRGAAALTGAGYIPLESGSAEASEGREPRPARPLAAELDAGPLAGLWSALEQERKAGDDAAPPVPLSASERLRLEEVAAMNTRLRHNPKDARLWLAFVAAQDRWSRLADARGGTVGQALGQSTAALSERKLAIFERALREVPDDPDLLAGYLRCGQDRWEYASVQPQGHGSPVLTPLRVDWSGQGSALAQPLGGDAAATSDLAATVDALPIVPHQPLS